jgi:Spy/CpxP family protein refolding chaperone
MKKLFLVTLAGFLFAFQGEAQVRRDAAPTQKVRPDSTRHHARGRMMNELNLTPEQKAQMKSLHENNKGQRQAIQNDASLTADQKKAKMKDLQKSQSGKMNSILTPDQQAKRKAYMEKMRAGRKGQARAGHRFGKNTDTTPAQGASGS